MKNCLYLKHDDKEEVINTVNACTRNKSTDFEDISIGIVANVIPVISKPLTHICNHSFKTGVFPSRMKIAKIKHILKSGAKTDRGNNRPIYLLQQFKKNWEKLFLTRLDNFINAKDILNSSQYGFRKSMSISHAIMELTEEISNTTDNKILLLVHSLILKRPLIQWTTKYLSKSLIAMACVELEMTG